MPNVELTQHASWTNTLGKDDQIGSLASVAIAFVDQVVDRTLSVATATAQSLYDDTVDPAAWVFAAFVAANDMTLAWEGAAAADNSSTVVASGKVHVWSSNKCSVYAAGGAAARVATSVAAGKEIKKVYCYHSAGANKLARFVAWK